VAELTSRLLLPGKTCGTPPALRARLGVDARRLAPVGLAMGYITSQVLRSGGHRRARVLAVVLTRLRAFLIRALIARIGHATALPLVLVLGFVPVALSRALSRGGPGAHPVVRPHGAAGRCPHHGRGRMVNGPRPAPSPCCQES
jgi:hypothetical protein